jgi:hypothetical protein
LFHLGAQGRAQGLNIVGGEQFTIAVRIVEGVLGHEILHLAPADAERLGGLFHAERGHHTLSPVDRQTTGPPIFFLYGLFRLQGNSRPVAGLIPRTRS